MNNYIQLRNYPSLLHVYKLVKYTIMTLTMGGLSVGIFYIIYPYYADFCYRVDPFNLINGEISKLEVILLTTFLEFAILFFQGLYQLVLYLIYAESITDSSRTEIVMTKILSVATLLNSIATTITIHSQYYYSSIVVFLLGPIFFHVLTILSYNLLRAYYFRDSLLPI